MATFSGGGRTREPGEMFNVILKDATSLNDAGFVLKYIVETTNKVDKCGATDIPACVNYRSTRDPHSIDEPPTVFLQGDNVKLESGIPVFRDGWAKIKVATNNAAGIRGDPVVCTGSGLIDKYTPTTITNGTNTASETETRFDELARLVGHLEADLLVGNTGKAGQDKVLVKLSIRAIGLIT